MAPRNLLKHIFRNGPHVSASATQGHQHQRGHAQPIATAISSPQTAAIDPAAPPKTPERRALDGIPEESNGDDASRVTRSVPPTISSATTISDDPGLDLSDFTSLELLHASIHEAKSALQAHLDSISITLALLTTLDGFSPTIATLKMEMCDKEMVCKERLRIMDDVEFAAELCCNKEEEIVTGTK